VLTWTLLAIAGFAAGVINAVAGGGSLVSFPALLTTGMGSVRHRAIVLAWPSLLGGLAGSWLLLHTSERFFRAVVPWLIVFACALLALQGPVSRWVAKGTEAHASRVPATLVVAQFLISVYGGYFGAGIGILMLAAMAIFIPHGLQEANGLKVLFASLINGISAVYFLGMGAVRLPEAGLMALSSVFGGWAGAHLAQRLPAKVMRVVVVGYGLIVAAKLFAG